MNSIHTILIVCIGFACIFYCIKFSKSNEVPWWRGFLVLVVGIFSFSIGISLFDKPINLAVLPLGVWIVYFILRNKDAWEKYRKFAWLGFWVNYALLLAFIISYFTSFLLYDPEKLITYIHSSEDLQLIATATDDMRTLLVTDKDIENARIQVLQYEEYMFPPEHERFPYLLMGQEAKRGSGLTSKIYIEAHGKGILVHSNNRQYYFTVEQSLFKEIGN